MSEAIQMPERVLLRVLTPEEVVYEGEVLWVQVPLHDGLIGIWPGHAPLIGSLPGGVIRYGTEGGVRELAVESGILRVGVERCTILASLLASGNRATGRTGTDHLVDNLERELRDSLSEEELRRLQREERADPG